MELSILKPENWVKLVTLSMRVCVCVVYIYVYLCISHDLGGIFRLGIRCVKSYDTHIYL